MVRIIDFKTRMSKEGEPFIALIVQGGISLVKSKETGMYYATSKKASIPSTFDEETAKSLVGQELESSVEQVNCEPYEFADEETGEIIELDYRWVYLKPGDTVEQAVKEEQKHGEPALVQQKKGAASPLFCFINQTSINLPQKKKPLKV